MTKTSIIKPPSKMKSYVTWSLLILILVASSYKTDATFVKLVTGSGEMGKLLKQMWPPDWDYFSTIRDPMLETVQMAIAGTTFGGLLAIPFALFAARNVFQSVILTSTARFVLNLVRAIPDLLYAAVFVAVFGIGPLPGVLALSFFSFGLIAKLTYESIEAIDPGPLEAMTAVGANKLQWIHFSIVPQVLAQYTAYFLYTFEVNVRAAAVLGLVGAGGIGLYLDRSLNQLRYDRASLIIIATLAIVLLIDYASTKLREKLL